jgi:hypothetical protein
MDSNWQYRSLNNLTTAGHRSCGIKLAVPVVRSEAGAIGKGVIVRRVAALGSQQHESRAVAEVGAAGHPDQPRQED